MSNLQVVVELIDKMTGPLTKLTGVVGDFAKGVQDGAKAELELQKNGNEAAKSQNNLAASLVTVGKALVGLKVAKDVFDAFAASVQAADQMDELAGKTGIAASALKDYQFAAQQSDTSLEGIIGGLNKLNRALAMSEEESSKQARAFDLLGISTTNADGSLKSAEETFGLVADKFKDLKDGPEKSALAFAIFGQQGKDLIPILNEGAKGISDLREESEQLGQMGPAAFDAYAASSGELMDGISKLNTIFSGLVNVISAEVVPVINVVIDSFIESFKSGGMLSQILEGIKVVAIGAFIPAMKGVITVLRGVTDVVSLAGKGLGALGAIIASVVSGDMAGARAIWQAYKDDVAKTADEHVNFTDKLWSADNANNALATTVNSKTTPSIKGLAKATNDGKTSISEYEKAVNAFNASLKSMSNEGAVAAYQAELIALGYSLDDATAKALARKNAMEQLNKENASLKADKKPARSDAENADRLQQLEKQQMVAIAAKRIGEGKLKYEEDLRNATQAIKDGAYGDLKKTLKRELDLIEEARARGEISDTQAQEAAKAKQDKFRKDMLDIAIKNDEELRRVHGTTADIITQSYAAVEASVEENVQVANGLIFAGKITQDDYNRYVEQQYARLSELTKTKTDEITIFWQEAAKNMQSAMADGFFDIMQGKMTDLGKTFKTMIDRMVANALAANLNDALFGKGFGKTGNLGGMIGSGMNWVSSLFSGARASGGPVEAGKAYLVGEKGPEPFIPKVSGTILPNASLAAMAGSGGGGTVQVNITAMDSQDVRRALEKDSRWLSDMVRKSSRTYNLGM